MPGTSNTQTTSCRRCGCTEEDCSGCIRKTGYPCFWVKPGLCSACVTPAEALFYRDAHEEAGRDSD